MIVKDNRLIADNGMRLVNIDKSIAVEVWLSPSDSVDNWREIATAEANRIEEEREKTEREIEDNVVE